MKKVLFVCLGNICRSPLAEEVFRDLVLREKLETEYFVDSCGTASYHIGELPDSRMRSTAKQHGLQLKHRGRQFSRKDFENFDYILAMDKNNLNDVLRFSRSFEDEKKVKLLREFDSSIIEIESVPDPYYGGAEGFEEVYQIVLRSCQSLLDVLKAKGWS